MATPFAVGAAAGSGRVRLRDRGDQARCITARATPAERSAAVEALERLRVLFADRDLFSQPRGHPILVHLCNTAPWTRRWLPGLVACLDRARAALNADLLPAMLRNAPEYDEAICLLEIIDIFLGAGFQVEVGPSVKSGRADLAVTIDQARVYVEQTSKRMSDEEEAAWTASREAWDAAIRQVGDLAFSGRFTRALTDSELRLISQRIAVVVTACRSTSGGAHGFDLDEHVSFAVARSAEDPAMKEWAEARGLEVNAMRGVPIEVDEIDRICNAITKKATGGQLPKDSRGVLVVDGPQLHGVIHRHPNELLRAIRQQVSDFPWILGVVLSVPTGPWSDRAAVQMQRAIGGRTYNWGGGDSRVYTLIENRAASNNEQMRLISLLRGVFRPN